MAMKELDARCGGLEQLEFFVMSGFLLLARGPQKGEGRVTVAERVGGRFRFGLYRIYSCLCH